MGPCPLHHGHNRSDPASEASVWPGLGSRQDKEGAPRRAGRFKSSKRFRYIREAFRDDELTPVCKLDETNLPRYPMGWQEWWLDQMLAEILWWNPARTDLLCGKKNGQQELAKRGFGTVLQERKLSPQRLWFEKSSKILVIHRSTLPSSVYQEKVLIMGSASNGRPLWLRIWLGITMRPLVWNNTRTWVPGSKTMSATMNWLQRISYYLLLDSMTRLSK